MEEIKHFTNQLFEDFYEHHIVNSNKSSFWDYIVISAADNEQKQGFELLLASEINRKLLPVQTQYLVIEDIPNLVLGSGGSTFHVLNTLEKKIEDICTKKVLLIHAGGFSKRLPNFSCLGKIFCCLPIEFNGKALSLLCLKLILLTPFLKLMKHGGLLICASDDIEPYYSKGLEKWFTSKQLNNTELVALAHPSPLFIGTTHGVYVLPDLGSESDTTLTSCLEVLQKPSCQIMKERGAVRVATSGEQYAYTDSMFFCYPELVKKMSAFAREHGKELYSEETCIYGDFLACMGSRSEEDKLYYKRSLSTVKQTIADRFSRTKAQVLVLHHSRFIHLGTMPEYLDALNPIGEIFSFLGMKHCVGSFIDTSAKLDGITINCLVAAAATSMPDSIMESCIIRVPIICESRAILNNCLVESAEITAIPACWMFHTTAIKDEDKLLYVTAAFMVTDDLKGALRESTGWSRVASVPSDTLLWKSKLFEAHESMGQSFLATWKTVTCKTINTLSCARNLYSMDDVVRLKYLPAILEHRDLIDKQRDLMTV